MMPSLMRRIYYRFWMKYQTICRNMKFKVRIVAVLAGLVVLSIYALLLEDNRSAPSVPEQDWNFRAEVAKTLTGQAAECSFAQRRVQSKGISTYDLFDDVDNYRQPSPPKGDKPSERVTAILIPHSHTDPGWLMTVKEYYDQLTKNILDNLMIKMYEYPEVKFVWGETVFLAMWWKDISEETKRKFKSLVHSGRIEIINGGWVAPDEAVTHYYAIIDQLMEGHQWVEEYLGIKTKVGWSPDPFGYSATMPYLLNRAGMKDMVILRIHDRIKGRLRAERNLESHWRQPWDLDSSRTDTFCHIMPYILYNFKFSCGPNPYQCNYFDFRKVPGKNGDNQPPSLGPDNIEKYAKILADGFKQKATAVRHNVIFHAMGDDFRYDTALEWDEQIRNYTMLRDYINKKTEWGVDVKYGTLTDYFNAIKDAERTKRMQGDFPMMHGDFFPYLDLGGAYWTGFYTSRPFWKQLGREVEGNLRSSELLHTLALGYQRAYGKGYRNFLSNTDRLAKARLQLAVFQHHDAITGTSKPHTVEDYERRLWDAKRLTQLVSVDAAAYLLTMGKMDKTEGDDASVVLLDIDDGRGPGTQLRFKKTIKVTDEGTALVVFNPVPKLRKELIRIRVDQSKVTVIKSGSFIIPSQLNPVWLDQTTISQSEFELLFYVELDPLGMHVIKLRGGEDRHIKKASIVCISSKCPTSSGPFTLQKAPEKILSMESDLITVHFDQKGWLSSVVDKATEKTLRISPSVLQYMSPSSGAYIFFPSPSAASLFVNPLTAIMVNGSVLSEMRIGHDIFQQTVRTFHTKSARGAGIEIENYLDMSGIQDSREILLRFKTSIMNKKIIYTDSNGYQMIKRPNRAGLGISGNTFPMATMCYMEDGGSRLSLLAGQPHGVASLEEGQLDIMLDRKLFSDDYRGLEEGVKDNKKYRSTFLLLFEQLPQVVSKADSGTRLSYPSLLSATLIDNLLRPVTNFIVQKPSAIQIKFSPLKTPLPCDLDIVNFKTLVPKKRGETDVVLILHRRVFQCGMQPHDVNCPLAGGGVTLNEVFKHLRISSMKEVTLSLMYEKGTRNPNVVTHLDPMEIITLRLKLE